jgi:hypothetical protein
MGKRRRRAVTHSSPPQYRRRAPTCKARAPRGQLTAKRVSTVGSTERSVIWYAATRDP